VDVAFPSSPPDDYVDWLSIYLHFMIQPVHSRRDARLGPAPASLIVNYFSEEPGQPRAAPRSFN